MLAVCLCACTNLHFIAYIYSFKERQPIFIRLIWLQISLSGCLTSCVMWGRSDTCKCVRTAAAPGQIRVQVFRDGREGNNAEHFSAPTAGKTHLQQVSEHSVSINSLSRQALSVYTHPLLLCCKVGGPDRCMRHASISSSIRW